MRYIRFHLPIVVLISLFSVFVAFLSYQQIFTNHYMSDTQEHIIFLFKYFYDSTSYYIPHPLWHYGVFIISKLFHISIYQSAVIFSTILVVGYVYIVYRIVRKLIPSINNSYYAIITFMITIIGPLCIPWIDKIIYMGQGSPNIWHNVTLWAVKPFAVLTMFFSIMILQTNRKSYYILAITFLIVSIFAKPSFAIMFVPAFIIFVALNSKYHNKNIYMLTLSFVLMSIFILSYQYLHTFSQGNSKVIIDFLGAWSRSSLNIPYSIVMALAFPVLFVLMKSDILQDDYILLSWIQVIIGILLYSCFAEAGKYYNHGNFGWSYMIALSLVYMFSIIKFFQIFDTLYFLKRYALLFLLLAQVGIGVYYFIKILEGQNPLYVAIFL